MYLQGGILLILFAVQLIVSVSSLHPCPSSGNGTQAGNDTALGQRCLYGPYFADYGSSPQNPNRMLTNFNDIYGYRTYHQPYGDYQGNYPYPTQRSGDNYPPGYQYPLNYYHNMNDGRQTSGYTYPPGYRGPSFGGGVYGYPVYWPQTYWPQNSQPYPQYPSYPQPYYPPNFQRRSLELPKPEKLEPRFLGRGSARIIGRDAELTCSFHDPTTNVVSNVAWVKVTGPYDAYMTTPPFACAAPGCNLVHLNAMGDFRYRVITKGPVSVMHIYDAHQGDFGIYRCAATGISNGKTQTVYQVIEFMQPPPTNPYPYGKK